MTEALGAPGVLYTKELPVQHYRRDYDHILEVDEWDCPSEIPTGVSGNVIVGNYVRPAGWYEFHGTGSPHLPIASTFVHHKQDGAVTVLREVADGNRWVDWMTDDPIPWHAQRMYAARVDPNKPVLVGGLGLGLFLKHLPEMHAPVYVVERSREVIDLVWPSVQRESMFVITGDFFDYCKTGFHAGLHDAAFDFGTVLTDFWTGPPWDHGLHDMFVKTYAEVNKHWPKAQQIYPRMEGLIWYMKRTKTEDAQRAMLHRMFPAPKNA